MNNPENAGTPLKFRQGYGQKLKYPAILFAALALLLAACQRLPTEIPPADSAAGSSIVFGWEPDERALVEVIDVQIYQPGSWPQGEPIPMNFTLPAGFFASPAFHGIAESTYTVINFESGNRMTLRMRRVEDPQWLAEALAGGLSSIYLDGFAVYYERHYIHVYRHVTITIVKGYIEYRLTGAEDEWDSLILISRAIIAGEAEGADNSPAAMTGNYMLTPGTFRLFGPDDPPVPLNFTLPDGFYQPWQSFCHDFPSFTLRYRYDTYIQLDRSYLTPYNPVRWGEWIEIGWNSAQLSGHTIYYIEVHRCCHTAIYHNGIAFEKDSVFYEIFGKNVVNVDMEILMRIARAIIAG